MILKRGKILKEFDILREEERIVLSLRSLYESYGYRKYKMSEFEEYRLYMENKNFLVSESVIAFTDLDGRLLALKPDVTLSIVRHAGDCEQRVYYNESVYRPDKAKRAFREISQMGLERIGKIDDYAVSETVCLAAKSLYRVSGDSLIEISHMGFAAGLMHAVGCGDADAAEFYGLIAEKNVHGIRTTAERIGLDDDSTDLLCTLPTLCGAPEEVLCRAKKLCRCDEMTSAIEQLSAVVSALESADEICRVRLDLSLLGEADYYNGIIFAGFINGLPSRVLSGGQYDMMLKKFGHAGGAIGFALYFSELELLFAPHTAHYDTAVIYDADCDNAALCKFINELAKKGSVYPCRADSKLTVDAEKVVCFGKDGVKEGQIC